MNSSVVKEELLQAYTEQVALRALPRMLHSLVPSPLPPEALSPGTPILYFYQSLKQKEPILWKTETVFRAEKHFVTIRKTSSPLSNMGYEDIRILPQHILTLQLMQGDVESAMSPK